MEQQSYSTTVKTLILAAGKATRLRPITNAIPKCLVPINGRPLLDQWILKLIKAKINEVSINTNHLRHHVNSYLNWARKYPITISERYETDLLGSAGTVKAMIRENPDVETLLVIYADNLSGIDLREFINYYENCNHDIAIAAFKSRNTEQCGGIRFNKHATITHFVEKGKLDTEWANAGVYAINRSHFQEILDIDGDDMARDILPHFVNRMAVYELGMHVDIGTLDAYNKHKFDTIQKLPGCRKAVFFDRDDTLMEDYKRTRCIKMYPDSPVEIRRLSQAGFLCFIATNQGWVHDNEISLAEVQIANTQLRQELLNHDAFIEECYMALDPKDLDDDDPSVVGYYGRKPGPGMLVRASIDHGIDLSLSYMIGDRASDFYAGLHAGCKDSFLLYSTSNDDRIPEKNRIRNLKQAVDIILEAQCLRY